MDEGDPRTTTNNLYVLSGILIVPFVAVSIYAQGHFGHFDLEFLLIDDFSSIESCDV